LQWLINRWGVQQLDAAVITHPHRDHVADIANLARLRPRILQRPRLDRQAVLAANKEGLNVVEAYEAWEARFNSPVTGSNPISCSREDGYAARTFVPTRCPETNLNNRSVVTVISYANTTLLIPGDNERASWLELLESADFVEAIGDTDILLAPHHGRQAGYCSELFEVISPRLTIVSDGPVGDTSATADYRKSATGWVCGRRHGGASVERKVLSTRKDGAISVHSYWEGMTPYLQVTIN
jgi:competence protein ComEC